MKNINYVVKYSSEFMQIYCNKARFFSRREILIIQMDFSLHETEVTYPFDLFKPFLDLKIGFNGQLRLSRL